ncbi:hypothetical protein CbuK_1684 [Coxiella burnetii CbuK_Q154]|nr:hypothetical protein CbuK_1684 [Coxiella burnetii CbuK_Q154]AIT63904.1 hypothetical protein CBNA_1685 [Coxiella burnetii str. Namibia]EDR35524.1 hypothetical protein COXBURSA334_0455 [Coxiella burnetii Q321]
MFLPYHYPQVVRKVRHPRAGGDLDALLARCARCALGPRLRGNDEGAGMTCEEVKVNI